MVFEIMKENQAKRAVKPEKKPKTAADRHKAAAEKKKETEEDASHALADDAAVSIISPDCNPIHNAGLFSAYSPLCYQ